MKSLGLTRMTANAKTQAANQVVYMRQVLDQVIGRGHEQTLCDAIEAALLKHPLQNATRYQA